MPGTILSQLGMKTRASNWCAFGHDLDGIGDQLAARQAVFHAGVVHGDAVADGDRIKLERDAARRVDARS